MNIKLGIRDKGTNTGASVSSPRWGAAGVDLADSLRSGISLTGDMFPSQKGRHCFPLLLVAGLLTVLALGGCGKADTSSDGANSANASAPELSSLPPPRPDPIDLTAIRSAFASADAGQKLVLEELIGSIGARDFAGAIEGFQRFSSSSNLTPAQKQAVNDVVVKLKEMASRR